MILTKSSRSSIDIDFEINRKIETGKINELLLIVPTNRKIRSLKKEIITLAPGQTTGKLNLETIGTFSTKLSFGNTENTPVLSEAASIVLIKQSFADVKLNYFSGYKEELPHGTLERIKNVIGEYKRHGITPELLMNESKNLEGSEKVKAVDIAKVYNSYQKKIDKLNVKETGDIYNSVIQLNENDFDKKFVEFFPDVNLVVVNGFDEFTSPEIEILNRISSIKNLEFFLSLDYYRYNPLIFSHLDKCFNRIVKKGFKLIEDRSPAAINKFQSAVRENLFIQRDFRYDDFKNDIRIIKSSTRDNEINLIAGEIKKLISEKNIEPQNICVAFNLIQDYSPKIRDIFSLYGIPFNLTDRFNLSTSSPVVSIINFLEIIENDFYYKNILRALSGGYIELNNINLSALHKSAVNLKIISGYDNWIDSLNNAITNLTGNNSDEKDGAVIDIAAYTKTLDDIKTLNEILKPFTKKMNVKEFHSNLIDLIYRLNIPEKILNNLSETKEENVKALTVFIETVTELIELFGMEFEPNQEFNLKFYLNNLRTAISSTRYNIKEKPGYGVQVTTINEIRGLNFDYLFISGMCDGDFPTRYQPEIFFSGSFAVDEYKHQTEERYHFYQSICSWNKGLYLTYPQLDERKELSASNFLTSFKKLFDHKVKSVDDYSSTLFSKEDILKFIGKHGIENTAEYLKKHNLNIDAEKIENAIKIDKIRINDPWSNSKFTADIYNGLSEKAKKILTEYKEKEFSTSQLETYALCPYKYFAERLLNLSPPEEPAEEIEALEMGSLLHLILYEFYTELKEKEIVLQQSDENNFKEAEKIIFKIARDKIEKGNFNSPVTFYEKEKILGLNGNRENSILYKFLEYERNNPDEFIPEFFEIGFGESKNKKANSIIKNLKAGNVNVRGKIDRIDINKKDELFKVIDYKLSGKKPTIEDLENGRALQLPLYMFAAKELIKVQIEKDNDYTPAVSEIYSLKFSKDKFGTKEVKGYREKYKLDKSIDDNKQLIEICIEAINKYVDQISKGNFKLTELEDRENKVCRYCSFKPICRIQEVS